MDQPTSAVPPRSWTASAWWDRAGKSSRWARGAARREPGAHPTDNLTPSGPGDETVARAACWTRASVQSATRHPCADAGRTTDARAAVGSTAALADARSAGRGGVATQEQRGTREHQDPAREQAGQRGRPGRGERRSARCRRVGQDLRVDRRAVASASGRPGPRAVGRRRRGSASASLGVAPSATRRRRDRRRRRRRRGRRRAGGVGTGTDGVGVGVGRRGRRRRHRRRGGRTVADGVGVGVGAARTARHLHHRGEVPVLGREDRALRVSSFHQPM